MRVVVVGAGVVGLSSAVLLAEAGHRVEVRTADAPLETTSAVAAALWYPYRVHPRERVQAWGARTYEVLVGLAAEAPASGVRMRAGTELLREPTPWPWWAGAVPDLERLADVPDGYAAGWSFTAPVVDMGRYLPWLRGRLEAAGGRVVVGRLDALPTDADVVVNAAGLGARGLAGDDTVQPVRGQVVVVEQPGIDRWTLDGAGLTYVVPRLREVVVGGSDEEGSEDVEVDPAQAETILRRGTALVPQLARARVLRHRVGLRPGRPTVRLEREDGAAGPPVVHCYGHGGAGVTLSWGCAEEVTALTERAGRTGGPQMSAADAAALVALLEGHGVDVWVDGGWGVDALLGEQTRVHGDLDIAVRHDDVGTVRRLLEQRGYAEVPREDSWQCNFVLGDEHGCEVDVHSFVFDANGEQTFGVPYVAESLTGTGRIDGHAVRCIEASWMVRYHTGYEIDADDVHDVLMLHRRLGIALPEEYRRFADPEGRYGAAPTKGGSAEPPRGGAAGQNSRSDGSSSPRSAS